METGPSLSPSPSRSISLLSMEGCLTQSQHSIATHTSGDQDTLGYTGQMEMIEEKISICYDLTQLKLF